MAIKNSSQRLAALRNASYKAKHHMLKKLSSEENQLLNRLPQLVMEIRNRTYDDFDERIRAAKHARDIIQRDFKIVETEIQERAREIREGSQVDLGGGKAIVRRPISTADFRTLCGKQDELRVAGIQARCDLQSLYETRRKVRIGAFEKHLQEISDETLVPVTSLALSSLKFFLESEIYNAAFKRLDNAISILRNGEIFTGNLRTDAEAQLDRAQAEHALRGVAAVLGEARTKSLVIKRMPSDPRPLPLKCFWCENPEAQIFQAFKGFADG